MRPRKGNRTIGIKDVMGRGKASVIQYAAIKRTQYAHLISSLPPFWKAMGSRARGATMRA